MGNKSKELINTKLDEIFLHSMNELESLQVFYEQSKKTFAVYSSDTKEKYSKGSKLNYYFYYALSGDSIEIRNKRIEEIKRKKIDETHMVQDVCEILSIPDDSTQLQYIMKGRFMSDDGYLPLKSSKKIIGLKHYSQFICESFLSNIVVVFESFLSSIYRVLIEKNPIKYLANNSFRVAELFGCGYEEFIASVIADEIDSKMRESIAFLDFLEKQESITINKYEDLKTPFLEIYYRRNAYVHTGGCINKDYLKKVPKSFRGGDKEGVKLLCDEKYCNNAIEVISKLFLTIVFELLKKENILEEDLNRLAGYYFERLTDCDYSICEYAYYLLSQNNNCDFSHRMIYRINYINCLKQLEEKEKLHTALEEFDVSAAEEKYKIAKECLADNNKKVYSMLNKSYPNTFTADQIKNWPIFIDFRKTEFFEKFKEDHKDDFEIDVVEIPNKTTEEKKISQKNDSVEEKK